MHVRTYVPVEVGHQEEWGLGHLGAPWCAGPLPRGIAPWSHAGWWGTGLLGSSPLGGHTNSGPGLLGADPSWTWFGEREWHLLQAQRPWPWWWPSLLAWGPGWRLQRHGFCPQLVPNVDTATATDWAGGIQHERRKGEKGQIYRYSPRMSANMAMQLQPHKRTSHVSNYDMNILICSRLSPYKGHPSLPHPYWAQCLPMQPHAYIELCTQLYQIDDSSLNITI